jgi:hypothetical protein
MRTGILVALVLTASFRPARAGEPATAPVPAEAGTPGPPPWHLDLTLGDVGLGLGHSPRIIGVRLNYRDEVPYVVYGVNATVWSPPKDATSGTVNGLLLGLPVAVAQDLRGLALGFGVGAEGDVSGLGLGLVGLGAGGRLRGIHVGGIGLGCGGGLDGLGIGFVGAGAGGPVRGILVGGLGAGAGGDVTGILVGGIGAGAGGRIRGLAVGGVGVGSGDGIDGIALALGGVGAPTLRGLGVALAVGGKDLTGIFLAPAYLHVVPEGTLRGISVSAWNRVLGEQRGVAIGIFTTPPASRACRSGSSTSPATTPTA